MEEIILALIKCPECGKEISDNATNCPNCGYSFKNSKFCKFCGEKIDKSCIICPKCGRQVEDLSSDKSVIINNNVSANNSSNTQTNGKEKNKWVAFVLCLFLGIIGAHKFYEGKIPMGVLYLFTFGLFGVGIIVDLILILLKPNPYYV